MNPVSGATASMTAFSRTEGKHGDWHWVWEVRSVNGRGLDLRLRVPSGFEALEPKLRKIAQAKLSRGNVSATLTLQAGDREASLQVNEQALSAVVKAVQKVQLVIDCTPPSADGLLSLRGVLEQAEPLASDAARLALLSTLEDSFAEAVDSLCDNRRLEGAVLETMISDQLSEIERLTVMASNHAEAAPAAISHRIKNQLSELLSGAQVPEERLAQEAAMLAVKADVREELDRLHAHIEAGRALIERSGPIGRELDFLTQELNREANTLCSKVGAIELKRVGLDLKKTVDQMREQVQNVE